MTDSPPGGWVISGDQIPAWQQPDGSLWRQSPDGTWVPVPAQPEGSPYPMGSRARISPAMWTVIGSLIAAAVGLALPWVSVLYISVSGLDTSDGKLFGALVAVSAIFLVFLLRGGRHIFGVLLLVGCICVTVVGVWVLIDITNADSGSFGISARPGSGLLLSIAASATASVAAAIELRAQGKRARRISGKAWAGMAVVTVALIAGGVALVAVAGSNKPKPENTVKDYLADLAKGDASAALKLGPAPGSTTFLTADVLKKQQALAAITNIKVSSASVFGDTADVPATYTFGTKSVNTRFSVDKASGKWRMSATTLKVDVSGNSQTLPLSLFGVPGNGPTVDVFPGPLQFTSANSDVTITDSNASDFATAPDDFAASPRFDTALSARGRLKVDHAVAARLTSCAKATSLAPDNCPQSTFAFGDVVPGTVVWNVTSDPGALKYEASFDSATTIDVSGEVDWSVTYKAKDFEGVVTPEHETTTSYVNGSVDLTQTEPALTLN